jgi:hypothetical protein
MVFQECDAGPFWMNAEEREAKRHDKVKEGTTSTRTLRLEELKILLQEKGLLARGKKTELIKRCEDNGIRTIETTQKIEEGWQGKPKGLLQILWERGWIDANNLGNYTMSGRQNASGVLMKNTSLKLLMANCIDFEEEESLLQYYGRDLGVTVDRTPKCHCELAGEGIEYAWGFSKNYYRTLSLSDKKGKQNFLDAVNKCISRDKITTGMIRKFSRRAREYIAAYYKVWQKKQEQAEATADLPIVDETTTPVEIEKIIKLFKTHRCAMDFDSSFCKASFKGDDAIAP